MPVEVVDNTDVLATTEVRIETVEVQMGGVQGPAGQGLSKGILAARPATATEGDMYAATDVDKIFIWFV